MAYAPKSKKDQEDENQQSGIVQPQPLQTGGDQKVIGGAEPQPAKLDQNKAEQESAFIGEGGAGGPTGPTSDAAAKAAKAQPANVSRGTGTGFTNLRDFVTQNQPFTAQLANQATGVVQDKVDEYGNQITESNTALQGDIDALAPDINPLDLEFDMDTLANNPDELERYKELLALGFEAPDLEQNENLMNANLAGEDLMGQQGRLTDESKRKQLLTDDVQKNKRAGITSFNNLLLAGDAGAREQLKAADDSVGTRSDELRAALTDTVEGAIGEDGTFNQYKEDIEGFQTQLKGNLGEKATELTQEAQAAADAMYKTTGADSRRITDAFRSGGDLSDDDLAKIGMDRETYAQMQPAIQAKGGLTSAEAARVSNESGRQQFDSRTPEMQAKADALKALLGEAPELANQQSARYDAYNVDQLRALLGI